MKLLRTRARPVAHNPRCPTLRRIGTPSHSRLHLTSSRLSVSTQQADSLAGETMKRLSRLPHVPDGFGAVQSFLSRLTVFLSRLSLLGD